MEHLADSVEQLINQFTFGVRGWSNEDATLYGLTATGTHKTYTILDVTGAGILTSFVGQYSSTGTEEIAVQVDGGSICLLSVKRQVATPLMIPFATSLKVTAMGSTSYEQAFAVLNGGAKTDRWHDYTALFGAPTGVHESTTVLDITGKGHVLTVGPGITNQTWAIQVDGGTIYTFQTTGSLNGIGFFVPFATSLKITTSYASTYRTIYSLA